MSGTIRAGIHEQRVVALLRQIGSLGFTGRYLDAVELNGLCLEGEWPDSTNPLIEARLVVWKETQGYAPSDRGEALIAQSDEAREPYSPRVIGMEVLYADDAGVLRLGRIGGASGHTTGSTGVSYSVTGKHGHVIRSASDVVPLP